MQKQKILVVKNEVGRMIDFVSDEQNTFVDSPTLPLLEYFQKLLPQDYFKETTLTGIIHALPSNVSLVDTLLKMGVFPHHMAFAGKFNSEYLPSVAAIKRRNITYLDNFLFPGPTGSGIVDYAAMEETIYKNNNFDHINMRHGNIAPIKDIRELEKKYKDKNQRKIIETESTTSGEVNCTASSPYPCIMISGAAVKGFLEPSIISKEFADCILTYCPDFQTRSFNCGIIGYGKIGSAWARRLHEEFKHNVSVYDLNFSVYQNSSFEKKLKFYYSIIDFLEKNDYIFSCIPGDITSYGMSNASSEFPRVSIAEFLLQSSSKKTLINCASDRTAFLSLIKKIENEEEKTVNPLKTIQYKNISILKSGYPFNFTNNGEWADALNIQITRALHLAALIQAKMHFLMAETPSELNKLPRQLMVHPLLQHLLVYGFVSLHPDPLKLYSADLLVKFDDINWITDNSRGEFVKIPKMKELLSKNQSSIELALQQKYYA